MSYFPNTQIFPKVHTLRNSFSRKLEVEEKEEEEEGGGGGGGESARASRKVFFQNNFIRNCD